MAYRTDIDRRRFIRGVGGVVIGLPALQAFLPRKASAQAGKKIYTVFMQQQNGVIQERFWPSSTGPLSDATLPASAAVSELKEHASRLVIIRGLNFPFGNPVGCGHSSGCNQTLTAAKMKGRSNRSTPVSESADVRMARELTPGRDPLTLYAGKKNGYLDDALSYGSGGSVRAGENNPQNAYMRLTGLGALSMNDPAVFQKLAAKRKSVNDLLRGQLDALRKRPEIGRDDRARLDAHFSAIRDLEVGMMNTMGPMPVNGAALETELRSVSGTHTANDKMEQVVRLQLSIIALAFASDRARVATLQIGEGNDHTRYMVDGVLAPQYHYVSHRVMSDGGSGDPIANAVGLHHGIDRIHARMFKHLIEQLLMHKTADGRPLLDDSLAVWLNSNADGPPHGTRNVPHIVAGSGGGFLKQGVHVNVGSVTNNKFLNTMITGAKGGKSATSPVENFGDPGLAPGLLTEIIA